MANQKTPGIDFFAPADVFDLAFWDGSINTELIERLRLVFASYASSITAHGIVDESDPSEVTAGDTTRPLSVTVNGFDSLKVDVNPGVAVSSSGHRIELETAVQSLELIATQAGDINVVYLQYTTKNTTYKLTRYDTLVPSRREKQDDAVLVKILTLTDFLNPAIVSAADLVDIVAVAVVDVETSTIAPFLELVIDMSRDTHSFNRPRFTSVDIDHRQKVGTGVATDTNIHALSVNDLSTAGLTLLQLIAPHGMIVSKDVDFPNVPGEVVEETFSDPGDILVDDISGTITGTPLAKYVLLSNTPRRLGRVKEVSSDDNYLAGTLVQGTNVVWFHPDDDDPVSFSILYSRVQAAEPPAIVGTSQLTFGQPVAGNELAIAGGVSFSEFDSVDVTFEDEGQYPRNMFVYLDAEGDFVKFPQVIVPSSFLDTTFGGVGLGTNTVSITPIAPAFVRVWMKDATFPTAVTLSVSIEISGTDENDASISETVTFDSTWVEPLVLPQATEELEQFKITVLKFKTVDEWRVISRTDDGNLTQVMVEMMVDPVYSEGTRDFAPVAKVFWNAFAVSTIEDIRAINQTVFKLSDFNEVRQAAEVLVQSSNIVQFFTVGNKLVLSDDFRDPQSSDLELSLLPKALDGMIIGGNQFTQTSREVESTRYISRAIHVGDLAVDSIQVVPFGINEFADITEVGIRYSTLASPDVWIPAVGGSPAPEFTTIPLASDRWVFLPGADVFKFQIFLQGRAKGVAAVVRSTSTGAVTVDSLDVIFDVTIGGDLTIGGCILDGICVTDGIDSRIELTDEDLILRAQSDGALIRADASMEALNTVWGTSASINMDTLTDVNIDIVANNPITGGNASVIIDATTINNILLQADDGSGSATLIDIADSGIISTSEGPSVFNSRFVDPVLPGISIDTTIGPGSSGILLASSLYISGISVGDTSFISGGDVAILAVAGASVRAGTGDLTLASTTSDISISTPFGTALFTTQPALSAVDTYTVMIPPGAFVSGRSVLANAPENIGVIEFGMGLEIGETIATNRTWHTSLPSSIPNGATLVSFRMYYIRYAADQSLQTSLYVAEREPTQAAPSVIAGANVATATSGTATFRDRTLSHVVSDDHVYSFYLQMADPTFAGGSELNFLGIRVTYTTNLLGRN